MDFNLELVQMQEPVIGQEFLTWLWFKSETGGGNFNTISGQMFSLSMEQRIAVQGGEGESKEIAVCSGPMTEMREARMGLKTGKKVHQAKIRLEQDSMEWMVQLNAADLCFSGLKTPKVDMADKDDDPDALFLEKMYLMEKSLEFVDSVYKQFLQIRLSGDWRQEVKKIRDWIQSA